jgi:cob(I)alamin adenosyltransferase
MKVYTGTGDRGKTSLFSGERISKANTRIEAYGELDELNSIIGALVAILPPEHPELANELQHIQNNLFNISALLATTPDSPSMDTLASVSQQQIDFLEKAIDTKQETLNELKEFILPGGHLTAAWSHVARTVCRRAERRVVRFLEKSSHANVSDQYRNGLIYLNRLSDYLFVLGRYCNHLLGVPETFWKK